MKKNSNQFELILKSVGYGITVQDKNSKLIFANDEAARIIGFSSAKELLSTPSNKIVEKFKLFDEKGSIFPLAKLPGRLAIQEGKTKEVIVRYKQSLPIGRKKRNSESRWSIIKADPVFNEKGQVLFAVNVFQDITEIKKAEEASRKLAAIVESSDDAIISQSLDGEILSWNQGAENLYGFKEKEVMGKHIELIVPETKRGEYQAVMEVIRMEQGVDHLETVRVNKDKRLIDVSLTFSPLKDQSGKVIGASGIGRDISQSKELERRKDAFISMASHELKTPITSMKAYIQVLQKKMEQSADEQANKFINKTGEQLDRLTELVSDLLDLSKIQMGKLELKKINFDLGQLLTDIVEDIQTTAKDQKIILKGQEKTLFIGDKDRIGQVIINLLSNAIKYSPGKKKVISQIEKKNNRVVISVQDFGIGISKFHQKKIFDRFYRAEGSSEKTFPGLGIGLYISSEIIKRHGGRIWVESIKNKGSTFFVSLPMK